MFKLTDHPLLAIGISLCMLIFFRITRRPTVKLPDLPWVYRDKTKWFSNWRARILSSIHYREAVHHAYNQYSRHSRSCILPSLFKDVILLPPESINWIATQPDSSLSFKEVALDLLQFDHTWLLPQIAKNPSHHDTIRIELTRQLGNLTADLLHELADSFEQMWGTNPEWKEIGVYETLIQIVARTSNRVFVGLPSCRNDELLSAAIGFAQAMPIAARILRPLPSILRPVISPLVANLAHKREREFTKLLIPIIVARQKENCTAGSAKPKDFLQWTIDRAASSGIPFENEPRTIATRLLIVEFAAIHTSTFSITNAIFDLVASEESVLDALREEAKSALAATGGIWSKATVQKMIKHDSTLRESSRLGILSSTGVNRLVVDPQGLVSPDGTQCPHGAWIGVAANAIHHDPANYSDVETYKPFRFSDMKEGAINSVTKANLGFVTTSPTYVTFGHGKHACPGRFFAANELKLLLAYMVLNYDFEMLEKRPPSIWLGQTQLPPLRARIRIKRRKTETESLGR